MKNIIFIFFLLIFCTSLSNAQNWQWSKHFGSDGSTDLDYAAIDSDNNNDIILYMQSRSGSKIYFNNDTLSLSNGNILISKLDNSGNTIWVKQVSSVGTCSIQHHVLVDKIDNSIYLYGAYCNSMFSDCGSIYHTGQYNAMYISKYDSNGDCLWAKKMDSISFDESFECTLDDSSNLYVSGQHWNPVKYDSIGVDAGTVISKFDANGNCLWIKNLCPLTKGSNPRPELEITSFKYKNGFLYINAYGMHDTVSIDSTLIIHPGQRGALVAKLTTDADLIWFKEGLGYSPDAGVHALDIDNNGNVYASGVFTDSVNFGGTVLYGGPQPFPVGANLEAYFIKYDSSGNQQWVKQFHQGLSGNIRLITDGDGYSYLAGGFNDSIDFGNFQLYSSPGKQEMYLARFSPDGNCLGVKHFGDARGINLDVDNNNDVIVVSQMNDTATVDQQTYTTYGGKDIVLSKCSEITGIETVGRTRNNALLIYANPTNGKCNITIPDEFKNKNSTLTLSLFDNNGKVIRSFPVKIKEGTIKLDLEYEAAGIYLVTLSDGQRIYRGKIVFE